MKKRWKRESQLEKLSDEVIQQRWLALRPKALKGTLMFGGSALFFFAANHFFTLSQTIVNVVNVAFQICLIFGGMATFLLFMTLVFGRVPSKSPAA